MKFNKQKFYVLLVLVFAIFGISGWIYSWRIKNYFLNLQASYQQDIQLLEEEVSRLRSEEYELFPDPESVALNKMAFPSNIGQNEVRILSFGHIYGSPVSEGEDNPPEQLVNRIDAINDMNLDMIVLMGDLVYNPSQQAYDRLKEGLLDKYDSPVFNAVGNHDLYAGKNLYFQNFGQTFFTFPKDFVQIVVLDTEMDECKIIGRQKEMLNFALDSAENNPEIQAVLVFMHKVLFEEMSYEDWPDIVSNEDECLGRTNLEEIIDSQIRPLAESKPVYLFAGDVGKRGDEFSYFSYQLPGEQVFFITAGIGGQENDSAVLVTVNGEGVELEQVLLAP